MAVRSNGRHGGVSSSQSYAPRSTTTLLKAVAALSPGRHAAAQFTYLEAIAHLERGLGLLYSLPESPTRDISEIELQLYLLIPGSGTDGRPEAMGST